MTADSVTGGRLWGEEIRLKMRNDRLGWARRGAALILEQNMWLLLLFLPHLGHICVTVLDL